MGYFVPVVDGVFGDDTLHAVMAFQKANRIGVDGAVGPETRKALKDPVKLVPKETTPERHVEVDIDRQILMFVWQGRVTHVFDTSTGSGNTFQNESGDTVLAHTPRGHFAIDRKIDGPHTSFLGEMWRPSYFYGGYAIHGSPSVPAYPASHGCVRLTDDAMNWAFDRLPIGTPVFVYPDD
jgi:lipoprotein-anchoring transpeptidase ErfK/SrfK